MRQLGAAINRADVTLLIWKRDSGARCRESYLQLAILVASSKSLPALPSHCHCPFVALPIFLHTVAVTSALSEIRPGDVDAIGCPLRVRPPLHQKNVSSLKRAVHCIPIISCTVALQCGLAGQDF